MRLTFPRPLLRPSLPLSIPKARHISPAIAPSSCRKMSTTTTSPSQASQVPQPSQPQPQFSTTYSSSKGSQELSPLLGEGGGRWRLTASGKGVERSFRFKGFKKTWDFMNVVAEECKVRKHHPEWSNVYNTTFIRWTTHSPPGLSEKDVLMARFCDEKAEEFGEVESEDVSEMGKELADTVATAGGDCCVPKKKEA